ncbi:MAG: hypothetical protein JW818_15040 [Pirellulales bacterium]|nr:hypothetical protein [Pirellulales bacterium]
MVEPNEQTLRWACPGCGAMLRAKASAAGGRFPCPKCKAIVEVPSPEPVSPPDEYAVRDVYGVLDPKEHSGPVVPVLLPEEESDYSGEDDSDKPAASYSERPKLPRFPMIQGVLSCFGSLPMLIRWGVLSASAGVTLGFVLTAAIMAASGAGSVPGLPNSRLLLLAVLRVMGLLIACAAAFLGLLWTVTASAYGLAVLQDSAAGNKKIENWPDAVWLDWASDAFHLFVVLLIPIGIAHGLGYLLDDPGWLRFVLCCHLLFPVVLLSTLDAQSPFMPLTTAVLWSMIRCWWTWIVFYVESGLLGAAAFGLFWGTWKVAEALEGLVGLISVVIMASLATGMILVATEFLYFRLLGRLAWVCDETVRRDLKEAEQAEQEAAEASEAEEEPEVRSTPVDEF